MIDIIQEIFKLNNELQLPEYDLILIGDGSGTVAVNCCGWACIAFDTNRTEVTIHNGSMSCGSNNFAELIPYIQALWLYESDRDAVILPKPRIEIVSDSEVSVKCGNKEYSRKANRVLWSALDWFTTIGYNIHWTHIHRNTNPISKKCDWLAGESRCSLEALRVRLLEEKGRKHLTVKPGSGKI